MLRILFCIFILFVSNAHAEEAAIAKYTCPMHPQIISDKPGQCPICGMDLVLIAGVEHNHAADEGSKPVISITSETIQKMGVRTEKVSKGSFGERTRATGIIMENERKRWDMFSQVEGRVDDLKFSAVGDHVKKGEAFYTLSSPRLTIIQGDYIAASTGQLKGLKDAAKYHLKLIGIDERVISTLEKTHKPLDKVPFYIPATGVISKLEIRNGHYLKMGDEIGHIQDLSTLWVEASVSEKDISSIKVGEPAEVSFTGGQQKYDAKVDYIYPDINPESRTAKVRLIVENKDGALKPAAYASVTFASGISEKVSIPSEAILRSADGNHVIVALGDGKFQVKTVETGTINNGRAEIISGLSEGDEVVISSQFLIDSESSLRESLNKISGGK